MNDHSNHAVRARLRFGSDEVEASGSQEAVHSILEVFFDQLSTRRSQAPVQAEAAGPVSIDDGAANAPPPVPPPPPSHISTASTDSIEALRKRVFRVEGEVVSLNAIPKGDDADLDAIMLILYGRQHMLSQSTTIVGTLLDGLKQSGITINELSRLVTGSEAMVTKAGIKRGTRYGLTNRGIQRAEEVMRSLI